MRIMAAATLVSFAGFLTSAPALAQDLGPQIKKFGEGIYVYVGKNFKSNTGIILTQDGAVLIDSGHEPTDSRAVMERVKKLSPMPVRFLIDTEPHPDHTTGHFVFATTATIIAAAGAGESMRNRERQTPDRIEKLAATSPEMKAALEGYKFIPPHVEYSDKMTLYVGERTFELRYMKGVHSEADTAIWLPKERVLFSASAFTSEQINIFRPFVNISDILVGNIDERTEDVDLLGRECGRRKQHALFGQPDGGIGFAVNAFHVPQLEGSFAHIQRHLVAVLDVRWEEFIAFQRSLHFRRRGGELFDPIRRLAFAVAHRLTGAGCGDDGGGRGEDEMTGRMIGMRLRVDEEAHRHGGELLDGVHDRA